MKRLLAIFMTLCMVLGLSVVNVWATEEATWQAEAPMSTARYGAASCVIGDEVYVTGGWSKLGIVDTVEIYNTKTHIWSVGKPMPEKLYSHNAVAVGDKIYVLGGITKDLTQNNLFIYDVKKDIWTTGEAMPITKSYYSSVAVDNKIYVLGGINKGATNSMEIYDTETQKWSIGKPMTHARRCAVANTVGKKIYAIGGLNEATMEIYDIETEMWSDGASIPTKTTYATSETVGDKIYVMGGDSIAPTKVQVYSTTNKKWETGPALSVARKNLSSAFINGKIYIVGGSNTQSDYLNTMESLQVWTLQTNRLSALLNVYETIQLSTSYNLADNTNLTWSSTNDTVATVDANGKVTAVGQGHADIYVQNADGTLKEYIPVKVIPNPDNIIRLAANIKAGEKLKLHLVDDPSQVVWSSMNESIATVSSIGEVTAVKRGFVILQGEFEGQTYQIYVRVY